MAFLNGSQSDSQGFLVGEVVAGNKEVLAGQVRGLNQLREIRKDVRAISRSLGVPVSTTSRSSREASGQQSVAQNSPRRSAPGPRQATVATPSRKPSSTTAGRTMPARDEKGRFVATVKVQTGGRDAKGRFAPGSKNGEESGGEGDGDKKGGGKKGKSVLTGAIAGAAKGASLPDNLDPTLNAAKEAASVVAPLGRGLAFVFGRNAERQKERKRDRWFTRILKAIQGTKAIGGLASFGASRHGLEIGGLLGRGVGGVPGAGASLLSRGLKLGGGLLKRLPLLGALFSGGAALASAFGMNDDPNKSDAENRKERYRSTGGALGMGAGGLIGAALGSFFGPVGTVAGGWLGAMLGEKVGQTIGDWTRQLMDSDLPGKMLKAWEMTTAWMSEKWAAFTDGAAKAWAGAKGIAQTVADKVTNAGNVANSFIKDKTGIDVKGAAGKAWDATKGAASKVMDPAIVGAPNLVPETIKNVVKASTNAISKVLESGKGYNVVQNADGSVVRQEGARNWRNNNPGNIEYGDFAKKHGAIGSDGRFAIFPDMESGRAAKSSLIFDGRNYKDLSLNDAIARYAPPSENNTKAYQAAVLAAVGGQNKRMGDYSTAERNAIMDAMQRVEGYKVGKVSSVTPAVPRIPSMASAIVPSAVPAKLPQAPELPEPRETLADRDRARQPIVVSAPENIGQNVGDRALAHIVTGGLGG